MGKKYRWDNIQNSDVRWVKDVEEPLVFTSLLTVVQRKQLCGKNHHPLVITKAVHGWLPQQEQAKDDENRQTNPTLIAENVEH